jgi:hypothetical protein
LPSRAADVVTPESQPVVHPVGSALPELDRQGLEQVPAPVRRRRDRPVVAEAAGHLGYGGVQFVTVGDDARLG